MSKFTLKLTLECSYMFRFNSHHQGTTIRTFFYLLYYLFHQPGISRGIYRDFYSGVCGLLEGCRRLSFLVLLLVVLGWCVWGSLLCWRCLCGIVGPSVGGEIWGPTGGVSTIGCILAERGWPSVLSSLDSCNLERAPCWFCKVMNGSCRGLLETEWVGSWAIGRGKVCGKWWVCKDLCGRRLQILRIFPSRFLCSGLLFRKKLRADWS